jgi:hypothetical protein
LLDVSAMKQSTRIAIVFLASFIPACALDDPKPPPTSTASQSLIEPVCFDDWGDPVYDDDDGQCDPDDPWGGGGGGGGGGGWCWPSRTISHESCAQSADPGTANASAQASASTAAEYACYDSSTFCIANPGPATYNTHCGTLTNGTTSCCSTASVTCSYSFTY